jgi:hypothetical protein
MKDVVPAGGDIGGCDASQFLSTPSRPGGHHVWWSTCAMWPSSIPPVWVPSSPATTRLKDAGVRFDVREIAPFVEKQLRATGLYELLAQQ